MSRSLTINLGGTHPQNATEKASGTIVPRTKILKDRRRGQGTAKSTFGARTLASDAMHNPPCLLQTPRHVPRHKAVVQDTPHRHGSDSHRTAEVEHLQQALNLELEHAWIEDNGELLGKFFSSLTMPRLSKINAFLLEYLGYINETKKWIDVPDKMKLEELTLYNPLVKHINAILRYFQLNNRRVVMNISHLHERHRRNATLKPGIFLQAYGPGFAKAQLFPVRPTYGHCAAPIEVRTDNGLDVWKDERRLAVYARECFVQQPNKRLEYGLLLTEKRVRVYQFDRGGVLHSQWYDIGLAAITFVQIILAIASPDESQLGLDTCIFWNGDERYFEDPMAENVQRYTISYPERPFCRRAIRGRGTTFWTVKDVIGKKYVLKFSWKSLDRVGEWEYLQRIKDANPPLKHVGTMESHRMIEQISSLRPGVPVDVKNFTEREYYYTLQPYLRTANREVYFGVAAVSGFSRCCFRSHGITSYRHLTSRYQPAQHSFGSSARQRWRWLGYLD
ncbi:hypothetical protein NEOLEDRAFT_979543 [Neolentinus lepideus HHB14362 ss-1]|uniref:Fungal-type protein kinase domain-containing protein n=1 Tax=Neolentinus lepideus HHB14362 ss-1 TaxID=1314782 RepID=A0A165N902_9AGAM|nr:hypothetical protein NEOLEDRAFT_979543 [Neolentinus lepideus HHB14362 ss-1]